MSTQTFQFADCAVHEASRQLWLAGQAVDIQRLQFDLLLYFLRHPQRVISKDELLTEVWRTLEVTESVVSRAVMKLRRAIGDEGDAVSIIRTVHRVGYVFQAQVSLADAAPTPAPASVPDASVVRQRMDLAFLRLDNQTAHDTLNWTCSGLPALLAHICEQRGMRVAAIHRVTALELDNEPLAQRAHLVCEALEVPRVASFVLTMPDDMRLMVTLHGADGSLRQQSFVEPDVARLAMHAAEWLAGQSHAKGSLEPPLPASVLELLAKAESEFEKARYRAAMHLFMECADFVPDSLRIRLALARTRQQMGQMDQAALDGEWVRQGAAHSGLAEVQVNACLLLTHVHLVQGNVAESGRALAEALALSRTFDDPEMDALVAEADAQLAIKQGRREHATKRLEYALARLSGGRNVRRQIAVRMALANSLIVRHQLTKGALVLDRARQQLQALPNAAMSADADFMAASIAYMRHQHRSAAQLFDEAKLKFQASDRATRAWRATNMSMYARTMDGALSEVRAECMGYLAMNDLPDSDRRWRPQSQGPYIQLFLRELIIELDRRADHPTAVDRHLALLDEMAALPYCVDILPERRCTVAVGLAHMGRIEEAKAVLLDIDATTRPHERGVAEAAVLLAQGQAEAALGMLEGLATKADLSSVTGAGLAINICWLKLELGRMDGVDSLIAHIDELCDDYAPAAVVRARYMLQMRQQSEAHAEWRRVLARWPESPQPIVHDLLRGDHTPKARQRRLCMLTQDLGP